jgi:hypothetical protein
MRVIGLDGRHDRKVGAEKFSTMDGKTRSMKAITASLIRMRICMLIGYQYSVTSITSTSCKRIIRRWEKKEIGTNC